MMIEVEIDKSDKKDKKLVAKFRFPDGKRKTTHFGAKGYSDFTIHKNPNRKAKYLVRHNSEDWEDFTSAGALSRWILWNEPHLNLSFNNYLADSLWRGNSRSKPVNLGISQLIENSE